MPIYEYECRQCGHRLEQIQKVGDAPLTLCPQCGQKSLQKCVSLPSFQLKGSGWYATDYKNKGKPSVDKKTTEPARTTASAEASSKTPSDTTSKTVEPSKKTTQKEET